MRQQPCLTNPSARRRIRLIVQRTISEQSRGFPAFSNASAAGIEGFDHVNPDKQQNRACTGVLKTLYSNARERIRAAKLPLEQRS
jgi:hypothetical protein